MALPTNPEARAVVLRRASRLAGLTENAGFRELAQEAERKEKRNEKSLMARIMAPSTDLLGNRINEFDQRDVDYWRGFNAGMSYLLALPAAALSTLMRAEAEAESNREEDSGSE